MDYELRDRVGVVATTRVEVLSLAHAIIPATRTKLKFEELTVEERDRCLMIIAIKSKNVLGPLSSNDKSKSLVSLNSGEFITTFSDKPYYTLSQSSHRIHRFALERDKHPFNVEVAVDNSSSSTNSSTNSNSWRISLRRKIDGKSEFARLTHPSWSRERLVKAVRIVDGAVIRSLTSLNSELNTSLNSTSSSTSSSLITLNDSTIAEAVKRIIDSPPEVNNTSVEITESFVSLILSAVIKEQLLSSATIEHTDGSTEVVNLYDWNRQRTVLTPSDHSVYELVKLASKSVGVHVPPIDAKALMPDEPIARSEIDEFIRTILIPHLSAEKASVQVKNQLHTQPMLVFGESDSKKATLTDATFSVCELIRRIVWC